MNINKIMSFCKDALRHLENKEDEEHEMNQELVGIKELFRGHVVNDRIGTNMNSKKCRHLNAIIGRECVIFL